MSRIAAIPFVPEHVNAKWIEERHLEALQIMLENAHVRKQMTGAWAVTFIDAMNYQILGCFGVVPGTRECWAFLNRRLLDQDCYRQHKVDIVRRCMKILDDHQEETGGPCYARIEEGEDYRDVKFIETIGFKSNPFDEYYTRGEWLTEPTKKQRGVRYDLLC